MLLGRLRIWGKLVLLSVIPLVAIVALTIPTVLNRAYQAKWAGDTARTVRVAAEVGSLVQDLQQERLLAVGLLIGVVDQSTLTLQIAADTDRVTDVRADLGTDMSPSVSKAIGQIRTLREVRKLVLLRTVAPDQVMTAYGGVIAGILDSLQLLRDLDTATAEGRQVVALDQLLAADEATAAGATALAILAYNHGAKALATITASQVVVHLALRRITMTATPAQLTLRQLVDKAYTDRFGSRAETDTQGAIAGLSVETIFASVASFISLGNFVEKRIVADVTTAVNERRTTASLAAHLVGFGVALLIVVVLLLGVSIARSVAQPLVRLTASAERIARIAESELVRVADDESDAVEQVHLDSLDIGGSDEVGDLARAFKRVQVTAYGLVERQVSSRRNFAKMFGHIGRRTHNLVSRQVALIDDLERAEADPVRLRQLYRLDHLSNRLLRNASSLVVLSGSERVDEHVAPMPLTDVVRLALGEIEGYERVDVRVPTDLALAPGVVTDLALVIAELMENATQCSPPTTRVVVMAERETFGARLTVVDQGIGMPAERMAEENSRLTMRERLDLAPTQVLGLFVVGRLARRHHMAVALMPTVGGGVTVTVDLGWHLLADERARELPYQQYPAAGSLAPALRAPLPEAADLDALRRADELLAAVPPWNAFAMSQRPKETEDPGWPAAGQRPPVPAPAAGGGLVGHSGLRQRIPGAQHPSGPVGGPVTAPAPVESDADAVRALVDQFELGVTRAINDFGTTENQ